MKSDGGFESNWGADTDTKPLIDEDFGTWILVMEPSTLRPPHFVDAHMLMDVLQGEVSGTICSEFQEPDTTRIESLFPGSHTVVLSYWRPLRF